MVSAKPQRLNCLALSLKICSRFALQKLITKPCQGAVQPSCRHSCLHLAAA